jgi:hypothetical protein
MKEFRLNLSPSSLIGFRVVTPYLFPSLKPNTKVSHNTSGSEETL